MALIIAPSKIGYLKTNRLTILALLLPALRVLLSLYAFAVFGYVTASLATFFIGRDSEDSETSRERTFQDLREEIRMIRESLQKLSAGSS